MPFNKRGVSATPFHGGLEWKQLHRKMILDDTKTSLAKQGSHSDWKTWKNGKAFSSQGILNRLEKSGKIAQNTGKTSGNFRKMLCYFLVIFRMNCASFAKMNQVFSLKNKTLTLFPPEGL